MPKSAAHWLALSLRLRFDLGISSGSFQINRMDQVQAYKRSPVPLTNGARFIRGFRRIGMVTAAAVLVAGLAFSWIEARDRQTWQERMFDQASCIVAKFMKGESVQTQAYDSAQIDLPASGCPGSLYSMTVAEVKAYGDHRPAPMEKMIEPLYYGTLISIGCAAFAFLFFWMIGWLCAGFTRD